MSGNFGIIGVLAALFAASQSKKLDSSQIPNYGIPWTEPTTNSGITRMDQGGTSQIKGSDVLGIPAGIGIAEKPVTSSVSTPTYAMPTATNTAAATVKQKVTISRIGRTSTTPTQPTAVPDAAATWKWVTPGGIVESRPPTQEESDTGLGCPEVPGIWDFTSRNPATWRYCTNPDCPSNKPERQTDGTIAPAQAAVLEQQVDAAGNVSYFCRVCRTYQ